MIRTQKLNLRKFADSRRGSILILVVALLVLMALIGTAALTTNTIDRYATGLNTSNTEVDLLVEGVKNMAKSVLIADLYTTDQNGKPEYRPSEGVVPIAISTYDHWDMPLQINPALPPSG